MSVWVSEWDDYVMVNSEAEAEAERKQTWLSFVRILSPTN